MSIKFSVFILFITPLLSAGSPSHMQLARVYQNDSIKTVAIYSSKNSFFSDYPIDTLVSHLNALNTNSNITYCKNTEDNSKTGFYADYLIDADVWLKQPGFNSPTWEKVSVLRPVRLRNRLGNRTYGYETQYVNTLEDKYVDATPTPGEGKLRIKIIEKRKNERMTNQTFSSAGSNEQNLKLTLIIQLITYLLQKFSI